MSSKPELSATPGVQNVVVYVSNDNFAQAYAVGQNGPGAYASPAPQHPVPKPYPDKPPTGYGVVDGGYYVPPPATDDPADYAPADYVTVMGAEVPQHQGARCDSVRSETAESSCSSLSSADDAASANVLVQQPQHSEMLLYDPSVSVRPGGGVVFVGQHQQQQHQPAIAVPHGWKRILNNGSIVYVSPSNTALSSPEQVKEYLLTSGTCKCGLECHFKYDSTFNFDPKVASKPWTMSPDTNTGDLTKLCNHKRKVLTIASLDCKPPDPTMKLRKECNVKKTKRKIGVPYTGCVPLSQIFTRPDKMGLNQHQQHFAKEQPQVWPQSPIVSQMNRLQNYPENQHVVRYQSQEPSGTMMVQQAPANISQPASNPHHIIGPNGQVISVQTPINNQVNNGVLIQGQNVMPNQQHRVFINSQPTEPSGPGRPNIQMVPMVQQQRQERFYNGQYYDASKQMRPFMPNQMNGFRQNNQVMVNHQKMQWNNRVQNVNQGQQQMVQPNAYDRVPPLHQQATMWQEEIKRKKVKLGKIDKRSYQMECPQLHAPCPNIDVRQIPGDNRQVIINHQNVASPSFLEDPSGYLAQQTALLNNTINRQTGVNACPGMVCNSPITSSHNLTPPVPNSQTNEVPLPSNVVISHMKQAQNVTNRTNQSLNVVKSQQVPQIVLSQQYNQMMAHGVADSSVTNDHVQCQGCVSDSGQLMNKRPNSQPGTPSSSGGANDDPVTSSTFDKQANISSPDSRPIQGGTVSTSNVSPMDGSSDPPTPNPHTPTPPRSEMYIYNQANQSREVCSSNYPKEYPKLPNYTSVVTTMASGRTVGSNTITSVLAGRANTATVSINNPANHTASSTPTTGTNSVSKSPLEMVQSVVSSIQVPQSQTNPQVVKHSPGLPPGHILVSSGGQLIMANTGHSQSGVMPPPPPKIVNQTSMPPISVSPMITNVTAAVSQVIPAVAQQVLGQQTVLVNALPAPFVLQGGVMVDGSMAMGQNVQLPQIVGNVIQQQIQLDNSDPRRTPGLLSPENKKKGKKRKMSSQTVANMLQIAAQQNSGVVMSQQGFPQQIQMAHSPQGLTTPVMQALTIVPSKTGGPPQIVMNGQPMANTSPIITNSQPQQINLLQPVNLINGTTGVVQNFPTIQQFIVPNLGGMVMNPDGTATILQDTSNIGMQLQLQNVNGQNVLTPVQNNGMFNGGQSILASPAGMVIRAPSSQGKIIQQQQHSPGAQFLSPNGGQFVVNGTQFSGQLSPLVASVSPSQQVAFGTPTSQIRPNQNQQEFIQCGQMGQTLMVPCAPAANIAVSSSNQNTTFVQQNTTIVQQQTTMVSNNQQQLQNFNQPRSDQNFIINDNKQVQALLVQRESPQNNYRHSVSTQTAVNQNVTTNTFCQTSTLSAGSPPDTTTHSPLASGGQSPPTADTTTHSGSTDDGLSPAPSNCSNTCDSVSRQPSCTMAMVHCISSSEPDSADLNTQNSDHDWRLNQKDLAEIHFNKKQPPPHVAYAESSTMMTGLQFIGDQMKAQEAVVSSHNFDKFQKRKSSDTLLVMETHMHSSLFDEDDEDDNVEKLEKREHNFVVGDLVWGPAKTSPAWPGKIVGVDGNDVSVKWFGNEKFITKLDKGVLQTLTEGLDAHHHARKKYRTSRKLNSNLEKAIQEAMAELDKDLKGEEKELKKASPKKSRLKNR